MTVRASPSRTRPRQQGLGAGQILGDQTDFTDVRLRSGPGEDGGEVLHLIGGSDGVVGLEVGRSRPTRHRAFGIELIRRRRADRTRRRSGRVKAKPAASADGSPEADERVAFPREWAMTVSRPVGCRGKQPDDRDRVAGRPSADDRVDDRQSLARDSSDFVIGQIARGTGWSLRPGSSGSWRAVAVPPPSATDSKTGRGRRADGPGSRSRTPRAVRGSSDPAARGALASKVSKSSGFSSCWLPSLVKAGSSMPRSKWPMAA